LQNLFIYKTAVVTEWGVFVAVVMMFGLKMAPTFAVTSGMLLGHIVSKEEIAMDPDKVKAILEAPTSHNAKALSRFLGQIRWHNRMIRHLADFATPLHVAVHRERRKRLSQP
jgi:hypothetical protein